MPTTPPTMTGYIRLGRLRISGHQQELELPAVLPMQKHRHLLLTFPPSRAGWAQEYFNSLIVRLLAAAASEQESSIKPIQARYDSCDPFLESLQRRPRLQVTLLELDQLVSASQRRQRFSQQASEQRIIVVYRIAADTTSPDSLSLPATPEVVQLVRSIVDALDTGTLLLGIQARSDQLPESLSALLELPVFEHLAAPAGPEAPWRLGSASEWQDRGAIEGYQIVPDEHSAGGRSLITSLSSLSA